jgi:hypothetical protein
MRIIAVISGVWILANLLLFGPPQLYGRLTGWYAYINPSELWYVWFLGPPVVLMLGAWGWRLLRRRSNRAAA